MHYKAFNFEFNETEPVREANRKKRDNTYKRNEKEEDRKELVWYRRGLDTCMENS